MWSASVTLSSAPCPVQPRPDGLRADSEQRCRFVNAHALDDPRHENRAKILGQFVDRAFDQLAELSLGHGALRIGYGSAVDWERE